MNKSPCIDYFYKIQESVRKIHVPGVNSFDNGINYYLHKQWRFWRLFDAMRSIRK